MKPNTSLTGAASRNGTSAGSLAGRHRQAFTLVEPTMRPTQKNRANDNFGGATIGCQTEGVANSPATSGKEVKRMSRSKRNSRFCLVERRPWSQRFGGFTLIELLVVIALVALLLGLLVPCLHPARKKATQVQCYFNLKALGMAVQMYADDNDGRFPNITDLKHVPQTVKEALESYVKAEEIFWCPDDPEKSTHPGGSYDWRVTHDPKTSLAGVRLDLIRHPDRVIIAGELSKGWHKSDMMNVLYLDGHVNQVTVEEWFDNITRPLQQLR